MVLLVASYKYVCMLFRLIFRLFMNILTTNLCNIARNNPAHIGYSKVNIFVQVVFNVSRLHVSELQYKELIGLMHHFGNFQGGVHQEQNYLSRPTKINGITLVLHVNCSLGCR